MTKKRSTKRALLLSALSLLMCVSMLVGSTFAWFTDSVTSGSNIIKSGNLKVALLDANGDSLEGEMLKWDTTDGRAQDQILWEPGCTYTLQPVFVKNVGNLALKYEIVISGIEGNAKLLEAIEWTVEGAPLKGTLAPNATTEALKIKGHMKEEAGNEYQDLTLDGISITVYATQVNAESDSFGPDYDKDAVYADYYVTDNASLQNAIDQANDGEEIALMDNIDLGGATTFSMRAVAAGKNFEFVVPAGKNVVLNLNGYNITRVSANSDINGDGEFSSADNQGVFQVKGNLTVVGEGVISMQNTGDNMGWNALSAAFSVEGGNLTLGKDVTVVHRGGSDMAYAVDVNTTLGHTSLTVDGATLTSTYTGVRLFNFNANNKATVNLNSGKISGDKRDIWRQSTGANEIKIADDIAYTEADGIYSFAGVTTGTDAGLQKALTNGEKEIELVAGEYTLPSLSGKEGITLVGMEGTVIGGEGASTGFGNNFGKNTTIKNVTFSGSSNGVRWSYAQGGTSVFENCTFAGDSTYGFHIDESNGATFIFNNCTFIGFNAFAGDLEKIEFNNCTFLSNGNYGNTNVWNVAYYNNCTWGEGASFDVKAGTEIYVDGVRAASNVTSLKEILSQDKDLVLMKNITFTGEKTADRNNYVEAYGNKVGFAQYSGVLDGNGKTLTDSEGDKSYVVVTHGGTIKNLTIKNGARGIVTYSPTEDVILDNVVVDGAGYALNSTEHAAVNMKVSNSTINGWTSLAGFKAVSFTNCKLGENSLKYWQSMGYSQDYDRLFRVYSPTTYTECEFEQGYYLDLSAGGTATLIDCTTNGVEITAENYADYITIELPAGKTLSDCVTFG